MNQNPNAGERLDRKRKERKRYKFDSDENLRGDG